MSTNFDRAMIGLPAFAGGAPAFSERMPLLRPCVPGIEQILENARSILGSGALTNGPFVKTFEQEAAQRLGVRHCIAVSSCTSGLMLVLGASNLTGEVICPSFTFAATAHAIVWAGLNPVFADVDPVTLTLSVESTRRAIGPNTDGILAVHTYGTPCDVEGLSALADEFGLRVFYDAAHAFGSRRGGEPIGGFGDAEVFSLSPTKVLVAGEGGIIATNDDVLAERCRIGRDYGNPGDYNCRWAGLNARMPEINAATALQGLPLLERRVLHRNALASVYKDALDDVDGISWPELGHGDRSTFKDFCVLVEPERFGLDARQLGTALEAEGVDTRRYYSPPVHTMQAYADRAVDESTLPNTTWAAERILTLPMWPELTASDASRIGAAIARIHDHVRAIQPA